jgi:hypothetical protein
MNMLKNWDWKHTLLSLCGLGALVSLYLADEAKAGTALPFHLTAAGLTLAAMVFGYISKQLGGGPPTSGGAAGNAVKAAGSALMLVVLSGCLTSAPIVPVTPSNQVQVTSCENTATLHNADVVADFAFGGIGVGMSGVSAAVSDNKGLQQGLAVGAAIAGGLTIIGTALAGYSASNFASSQCPTVVGALPALPASSAPAPAPSASAVAPAVH